MRKPSRTKTSYQLGRKSFWDLVFSIFTARFLNLLALNFGNDAVGSNGMPLLLQVAAAGVTRSVSPLNFAVSSVEYMSRGAPSILERTASSRDTSLASTRMTCLWQKKKNTQSWLRQTIFTHMLVKPVHQAITNHLHVYCGQAEPFGAAISRSTYHSHRFLAQSLVLMLSNLIWTLIGSLCQFDKVNVGELWEKL